MNEIEIPEKFYIFIDRSNHITRKNLEVGKKFFSSSMVSIKTSEGFLQKYIDGSASYLPFEAAKPDCNALSLYTEGAINGYRVEYDAEQHRKALYPLYPSRLSAVYAFGDYKSCQLVNQKYKWHLDAVAEFRLLPSPLTRVAKLNMEIVSIARQAYAQLPLEKELIHELWASYWGGKGDTRIEAYDENSADILLQSGEVWEFLIEGAVEYIGPAKNA